MLQNESCYFCSSYMHKEFGMIDIEYPNFPGLTMTHYTIIGSGGTKSEAALELVTEFEKISKVGPYLMRRVPLHEVRPDGIHQYSMRISRE